MKVAYIAPSLDDTTGWGRWCNDFLRHVRGIGIEPLVFAPASARNAPRRADLECQPRYVLPELFDYLQSRQGVMHVPRMMRFRQAAARALPPGVGLVHSLEAWPWCLYGARVAALVGAPHVLTTHGRYGYIAADRWLDRLLYRRSLEATHTLVAVSDAVGKAIRARFGSQQPSCRILPVQNAVDGSAFAADSEPQYSPDAAEPLILSVTRFLPVKDLESAVRAFACVRASIPSARYFIVGPGNGPRNYYHQQIRRLIESERIEGVEIVGRLSRAELQDYYRRATLLLHTARTLPDDFEASGLILLEAGLFGLPAVASASGGISEVVTHEQTGLLAREGDVEGLAQAMLRLIRDPSLARRLGAANRRRALERNWSWYMAEQRRVYDEALRTHHERSA